MEKFETKFNEKNMDDPQKLVPESEISEQSSRSSGKGGQNVNKRSTKSEVRWNVENTAAFTPEEKEKIKQTLGNRINKEGDLIIVSQEERSWLQNKERAIERLNKLVRTALIPEKERKPTRPTAGSKERRLEEKKRIGEKKKSRSNRNGTKNKRLLRRSGQPPPKSPLIAGSRQGGDGAPPEAAGGLRQKPRRATYIKLIK